MPTEAQQGRRDVKRAERQLEVANLQAKADQLRQEAVQVQNGEAQAEQAWQGINSRSIERGFEVLTFQTRSGGTKTITVPTDETIGELVDATRKAVAQIGKNNGMKQKRDEKLQEVLVGIVERLDKVEAKLQERQDALADAQASTHHELEAYRDDFAGLFSFLAETVNPVLDVLNRLDPANPYVLAAAVAIEGFGKRGRTQAMKDLGHIVSLIVRAFAYYDPAVGFASIFTPSTGFAGLIPASGGNRPIPIS